MSTCTTPVGFKSGKDLGEEPYVEEERVTCGECGAPTTAQAAYEGGWQLAPLVCPCCRAPAGCDACCHGVPS
jgi:hypothetical protein